MVNEDAPPSPSPRLCQVRARQAGEAVLRPRAVLGHLPRHLGHQLEQALGEAAHQLRLQVLGLRAGGEGRGKGREGEEAW